jgi:hypothetical protein
VEAGALILFGVMVTLDDNARVHLEVESGSACWEGTADRFGEGRG